MEVPDSPSNRPRLASFDQRLADFDTFSPGSAPSQTHSLANSPVPGQSPARAPAFAPVAPPVIDDDDEPARLVVNCVEIKLQAPHAIEAMRSLIQLTG